jgi:hypothetical protein
VSIIAPRGHYRWCPHREDDLQLQACPDGQRRTLTWEQTNYSKLYQLYRRVEDVAHDLETRRQQDMKVTKGLVEELYDIAIKLKVLDGKMIL